MRNRISLTPQEVQSALDYIESVLRLDEHTILQEFTPRSSYPDVRIKYQESHKPTDSIHPFF